MSFTNNLPVWVWRVWVAPIALLIIALACLVFVFAWKACFAKDIEANVCGNDIKIHTAVYETVKSLQEVLRLEAAYKTVNLSGIKNNCMAAKKMNQHDGRNVFCNPHEIEQLSRLLDKEKQVLTRADAHLKQLGVELQNKMRQRSDVERKACAQTKKGK